jgi:TonB family protein
MEIFTYLIKVNIAIGLFYGFYALFFRNDTFFQWKRILLLSVFFLCILYPFWDISQQLVKSKILAQALQNGPVFPTYYLNEVVITAQARPYSIWNHVPEILTGVYYSVMIGLILWMLIQIIGVLLVIIKTPTSEINGQKVYLKKGLKTPFSFFGYIVLDSEQCNKDELNEILRHEKTHVRQWHSLDMIISDLMCAVCWFNPFAWLLKRELRINLEYLADRSVIHSGCNTVHYQFHLLRLSYHKAAATISNNFNFSPLKKRIFMMNKKQSSSISILKYALVIPLFAALLFFSSSLNAGTPIFTPIQEAMNETTSILEETFVTKSAFIDTNVVPQKMAVEKKAQETDQTPPQKGDDKNVVYSHVEKMPEFPGGDTELLKWLSHNITYPEMAAKQGISGIVMLKFVITTDGTIGNVEVLKGLDPLCDKEAIRVIKTMPQWTPGQMNGEAVNVWYQCPIRFVVQGDSNPLLENNILPEVVTIAYDLSLKTTIFEVNNKVLSYQEYRKISPSEIKGIHIETYKTEDGTEWRKVIITTKE